MNLDIGETKTETEVERPMEATTKQVQMNEMELKKDETKTETEEYIQTSEMYTEVITQQTKNQKELKRQNQGLPKNVKV